MCVSDVDCLAVSLWRLALCPLAKGTSAAASKRFGCANDAAAGCRMLCDQAVHAQDLMPGQCDRCWAFSKSCNVQIAQNAVGFQLPLPTTHRHGTRPAHVQSKCVCEKYSNLISCFPLCAWRQRWSPLVFLNCQWVSGCCAKTVGAFLKTKRALLFLTGFYQKGA